MQTHKFGGVRTRMARARVHAAARRVHQPCPHLIAPIGGPLTPPSALPPSAAPGAGRASPPPTTNSNAPPLTIGAQSSHADLDARERDLAEREAKLKKLEAEIQAVGGFRRNNWPICFPIWYHDIPGDIPEGHARRVVRELYLAWWVSAGHAGCGDGDLPLPLQGFGASGCVDTHGG